MKQHVLTGATVYSIHPRESTAKQRKVKLSFFPLGIKKRFSLHSMPRASEFQPNAIKLMKESTERLKRFILSPALLQNDESRTAPS